MKKYICSILILIVANQCLYSQANVEKKERVLDTVHRHSHLNPFEVTINTVNIDLKEIVRPATRVELTHAVKYHDKYYCFFSERGQYSFRVETRYFLIISKDGTILNNIEVPKEIDRTIYFDFFIRNDSLFAKTYMKHESFYFDINKLAWIRIEKIDDIVYEDHEFVITYLDFGEWGEMTWFIDKKTLKEYVIGANGTMVNKLNGNYYLTSIAAVREIENPLNLEPCGKDYCYQSVEREKIHRGTSSLIGSRVIYQDTTFSFWNVNKLKQKITTSFVFEDQLYQLYSDSNTTFIGKIENEKLVSIFDFGKKYSFLNRLYSYRGNNLDNNSRFLKIRENNNTFGFMEISNNNIEIRYFKHNLDTLEHLESDGFEKLIDIIVNSDNLSLEQIVNLEEELGGIDMKTDRIGTNHNGYYPKVYNSPNFKTKEFIKIEDKNITQIIEYLYAKADNSIKSIYVEWEITRHENEYDSFNTLIKKNPNIMISLKKKQNEIIEIITKYLGLTPNREKQSNNENNLSWATKNGLKIKMYGSLDGKKEIRMIIDLE